MDLLKVNRAHYPKKKSATSTVHVTTIQQANRQTNMD